MPHCPRLSCDDIPNYAEVLARFCHEVEQTGTIPYDRLRDYPSMLFGLETAWQSLHAHPSTLLFDTPFSRGEQGIPINGLVWMGTYEEMEQRVEEKAPARLPMRQAEDRRHRLRRQTLTRQENPRALRAPRRRAARRCQWSLPL